LIIVKGGRERMSKFEFYRANAFYFRRIFYYRYITYINFMKSLIKVYLKFFLLPVLVLAYVFSPQSDFTFKVAIIAAITIIGPIAVVILCFMILLAMAAWKHFYITGYSLLKQEQEFPTVLKIKSKLFFLDFLPFHPIITGLIGFLLSLLILYLIVSFFLKYEFGIPLF